MDFNADAILLGVLIGEGSFTGDGKKAAIQLKLHVRHKVLFAWLYARFGGKVYGPYSHQGRNYFLMMWRGPELTKLCTILDRLPWGQIDPHSFARYERMKERYGLS